MLLIKDRAYKKTGHIYTLIINRPLFVNKGW